MEWNLNTSKTSKRKCTRKPNKKTSKSRPLGTIQSKISSSTNKERFKEENLNKKEVLIF